MEVMAGRKKVLTSTPAQSLKNKNLSEEFNDDGGLSEIEAASPRPSKSGQKITVELIVEAIKTVGVIKKGASLSAIQKYVSANNDAPRANMFVKKYIIKGLESGVLVRSSKTPNARGVQGSFMVAKKSAKVVAASSDKNDKASAKDVTKPEKSKPAKVKASKDQKRIPDKSKKLATKKAPAKQKDAPGKITKRRNATTAEQVESITEKAVASKKVTKSKADKPSEEESAAKDKKIKVQNPKPAKTKQKMVEDVFDVAQLAEEEGKTKVQNPKPAKGKQKTVEDVFVAQLVEEEKIPAESQKKNAASKKTDAVQSKNTMTKKQAQVQQKAVPNKAAEDHDEDIETQESVSEPENIVEVNKTEKNTTKSLKQTKKKEKPDTETKNENQTGDEETVLEKPKGNKGKVKASKNVSNLKRKDLSDTELDISKRPNMPTKSYSSDTELEISRKIVPKSRKVPKGQKMEESKLKKKNRKADMENTVASTGDVTNVGQFESSNIKNQSKTKKGR